MRDSMLVTVPDEYLVEIGKASVQWSLLESVLDLCMIKLAGYTEVEPRAAAIFAHMTFPVKLDVFAAMVDSILEDYPQLDEYQDVLKPVREAQKARNRIAHGKWNYENGVVTIAHLTARGKVKTSIEPITIDELKTAAYLIGKASIRVWKLVVPHRE